MDKNTVYKRTLSQAKERLTIVQEQEKEFNKQVSNNNKQIKQISIKNKKLAKKISSHMKYMNQLVSEITEKSKKEEPQWEILEIECYGGEIRKLIDGEYRLYTDGVGFTATYLLQRSDSKIKTVKRLSDGEVFTVGDKVSRSYKVPRELKKVTEEFIIGDFFFEAGVNLMASSSKDHYQCQHIRDIEKVYPNPSPKEEQVPIKVEIMEFGYGKPQENKGKFYVANFNLPNNAKLPTEKYQSIKSAIEDVLNEDKIKHEKLLSKIESKVRLANMINTQANYLKETLDYINSLK